MYPDEGTSSRPLSPSRRSPSIDLKEIKVFSQEEDNVPLEMIEFERSVTPMSPALKRMERTELELNVGRPLTLFNDYEIVGGVPTFVLRREPDDDWHGKPVGLLSDGSRIALATESTTVCVYDLLDGCSLIAKKEGISTGSIGFLSFWNHQNSSTSDEYTMSKIGKLKEFKEEQVYDVKHDIDRSFSLLMDVFADTSTLWIARRDMHDACMHVTCITTEQCQHVALYQPPLSRTSIRIVKVGADVASTEYLHINAPYMNKTVLFNELDFGNESMQATPVVIQGKCIALNGFGQHVLFWKSQRDGQSRLNLYSKDPAELDASKPITYLNLGNGVTTVLATSLDCQTWTFNGMSDDSPHQLPLICILRVQHSNGDVLVWDADLGKILTRIDVPIKQVDNTSASWFGLSTSPDGKWLAILDGQCCTISLFSFFSGVQVWQTSLDTSTFLVNRFMSVSFNALSTRLVVNCTDTVYVFVPPCLIKDYIFDDKCVHCEINFKNDPDSDKEVYSIVRGDQLQAVSRSVSGLQLLLSFCFQQIDDESIEHQFLRVTNPFLTSKMAIMIHKDTCFSIILASLRETCSSNFAHLVKNLLHGRNVEHEFGEIQIKEDLAKQFMSPLKIECIVLYPIKRQSNDFIAILGTDGFHTNVIFIDPTANSQELLCFETGMVYEYVQSKDGLKVMCMKENGILIIDLEQKAIEHMVDYQVNFLKWIGINYREKKLKIMEIESSSENDDEEEYYSGYLRERKCHAPPQIANDGMIILLGWSAKDQKPVFITPITNDQDLKTSTIKENRIVPCWALDETFQKFSFVEFDEDGQYVTSIGTYSNKDSRCKHIRQNDWNPQVKRALMTIDFASTFKCNMLLCECDGCLKLLVLRSDYPIYNVCVVPLTPHSMNPCLPCLHSLDYPSKSYGVEDLDKFVNEFGTSFFNMPFNEKTNLHIAIEHKDVNMIQALTSSAYKNNTLLGINCSQAGCIEFSTNLLDVVIQQNSEDVLIAVLDLFKRKQIPFIHGAKAIKESFESIWKSNRVVFEELLLDNSLYWEMSTLDVPSHILNNKACPMDRVGTFDDSLIDGRKENVDIISNIQRSSNKFGVKPIHQEIGDTKVNAIVKVVCFENIAKIGFQGILHFLLLQQVPAYIYKTPIIKWTILYKWEHFWKRKSVERLMQFAIALGVFNSYVVCIGHSRHSLRNNLPFQVCTSLFLIVIVGFVMAMLREGVMQFKTYLIDGKKLFPNNSSKGVKHYLGSLWNLIELLTYAILIFLIVPMHFLSFYYTSLFPCFYVVLAIESILMWFKVLYFLQPFPEAATLVLMIENIIRDCIPFLLLFGGVLIGFSIGLFVMFRDVIEAIELSKLEENDGQEENETHQKIVSSFESPQKAMLTLFCAMIGTFDIEVYLESGKLSPIIILLFVLYLFIEAIIMFNMFIGLMSYTFDKVKSTEEEQLLKGRAQFIDACEVTLTKNQIKSINENIDKYLYFLLSKDECANKESNFRHGRINNIKDNVKKDLRESQTTILEEIKRMRKDNESLEQRTNDESTQALKNLEESLERKLKAEMKTEMMAMEERIKADNARVLEHLKMFIESYQRNE